jgi:hypothetical protein
MKKSMLTPAILICSMALFPFNANAAWFWLDIIKGIAVGIISTGGALQQPANAIKPTTPSNPMPDTPPTEQEIENALSSLSNACKELSEQGFPCGMHDARSTISYGNAREIASARADSELTRSVEQVVEFIAKDSLGQSEYDDISEGMEYKRNLSVLSKQAIKGAQTYLTYSYKTKNEKGKDVYNVAVVRVLDKGLFETALTDKSQGKSIAKEMVKEASKSFASKIWDLFKKK